MSAQDPVCPGCGSADMSRQVAAIVWEGRSDVELHGAFGGIAGLTPGFGVSNHLGRVSSDLAAALAPPPGPPSRSAWFKWIVALLALAACPFGLIAVVAGGAAARRGYATFVIGIAAIVVLLIVLWARRLRRDLRWRRAMPEIGAVWSAARYCGRIFPEVGDSGEPTGSRRPGRLPRPCLAGGHYPPRVTAGLRPSRVWAPDGEDTSMVDVEPEGASRSTAPG